MVDLDVALQSCAVWSGMPLGVLCGAVQELHQCLAPILEADSLLNLERLDIAEKDPVAPASAPTSPTPSLEEEEQIIQIPEVSCALEPEEAAHLEGGLDIWSRYPAIPPRFVHSQANLPLAGLVRGIPLGARLDLHSLGSLQVTISHGLVVREVCYEYQSWVITQASLQLPQFETSKPFDSPPRI